MSWEEYRNTGLMCRVGIRKGKAQLEVDLARDVSKSRRASIGTLVKKPKPPKKHRNCASLPSK